MDHFRLVKSKLAVHQENPQVCHRLQRCQACECSEGASAKSAIAVPAEPAGSKGRIYLIDAMSFIFRAYHAMARQRPMSTKTGIPTSATFVFVNMLRKLRADFRAAISGRSLRRERAHLSRRAGRRNHQPAQVRQQDADLYRHRLRRLQGQPLGHARQTWRSRCRTFAARLTPIAFRSSSCRASRPTT